MRKIKKDDDVIILTGKDKGRRGKVLHVKENAVVVEGLNLVKKHLRPNPQRNIQGGIIERPAAIHISNVAIFNPVTKKADKAGIRMLADGRKVRYFKSTSELVDI